MARILRPPFTYFGGKGRVANIIWQRLGDVNMYIEPCCGSAAVLLARPHRPKSHRLETINDIDALLVNFYRAISYNPEAVASHANWWKSELDLIARNNWFYSSKESQELINHIKNDPKYYDAEITGWWWWGRSVLLGWRW